MTSKYVFIVYLKVVQLSKSTAAKPSHSHQENSNTSKNNCIPALNTDLTQVFLLVFFDILPYALPTPSSLQSEYLSLKVPCLVLLSHLQFQGAGGEKSKESFLPPNISCLQRHCQL